MPMVDSSQPIGVLRHSRVRTRSDPQAWPPGWGPAPVDVIVRIVCGSGDCCGFASSSDVLPPCWAASGQPPHASSKNSFFGPPPFPCAPHGRSRALLPIKGITRPASVDRLRRTGRRTAGRTAPPAASSSSWVPCSTIAPSSMTRIRSASRIVVSRCAITKLVRSRAQRRHRVLEQQLGAGVDRAGRLVEDQQRRVGEERPGDRDQLPLPGRRGCEPSSSMTVS